MSKRTQEVQPLLFVLDRNGQRSRQAPFPGTELQVGRAADSGLVFEEPDVSRHHALLWREGNHFFVQDLHSTAGTRVNGRLLSRPRELRAGDVITFASAGLEFAKTSATPPRGAAPRRPRSAGQEAHSAHFGVRDQHAQTINMVARDQYITQVLAERRHLLLEVAAAKTRARWILLSGFVLTIAGFGFFAAGIIRFIMAVFDEMTNASGTGRPTPADAFVDPFGVEIFGIPSGLLGWAVAGLGMVLMIIGTVLHLMAIGRGRRVERELPIPPPQSTHQDP